jgi:hypothetical protein
MTEDSKIEDLKSAWKKIEEGEKAASTSKVALKESNEATPTSKKFGVADNNSKPVKPVAREMGAVAGEKEVGTDDHGTKAAAGSGTSPVKRGEGAVAGHKEVGDDHGSKKAVEGASPVPRKEGSGAAVQKYSEFRSKIKAVLGLSLDNPLNKTGDGLNKGK